MKPLSKTWWIVTWIKNFFICLIALIIVIAFVAALVDVAEVL